MHKRARARRQLLTSPGGYPPVEMAEPKSFLSPVSSCARKLDIALQRWGDSPGVPETAPETYRAGLGSWFGAAHAGPSRPAAETNTPAIGPGPFAAHPTPFSATPSAGPFARPDIDTRPIRSEQGLSFAEMLAVNANPDAGSGTFGSASGASKRRARTRSDFKPPSRFARRRTRRRAEREDDFVGERDGWFLPRRPFAPEPSADPFEPRGDTRRERLERVRQAQGGRDAGRAPGARERVARVASNANAEKLSRAFPRRRTRRDAFRSDPSAFAREEKRTHEKENEPEPDHALLRVERTVSDGYLPFFLDPDRGVPCVAPETLFSAIHADERSSTNGASAFFSQTAPRLHVMDVRFPHEFRGGHIRGSVNVWDPVELHKALLKQLASESPPRSVHRARLDRSPRKPKDVATEKAVSRDAFVLVCDGDFCDDRASKAFRHIRGLDRNDHIADYPALTIPHVYVLHGGFEAFVANFPQKCTGPRVKRDEAMFAEERRTVARALKDAWRVAGSARGLSRAPDTRPFGNGSFTVDQRESEEWWGEDDGAMRE
jgi:rhodanese-related sulfurtransferase